MTLPADLPLFEMENVHECSLANLLDTLLDKGLILNGELTLSVAGVELVHVGVKAMIASVETAEKYKAGHTAPNCKEDPNILETAGLARSGR